jgi:acyl-CoA synthetase (NDP forming)
VTENNFIHESVVYQLLSEHGIKVPKFETDLADLTFREGEPVVVKGLAKNLWHKSDEGALHFISFSKNEVLALDKKMRENLGQKYQWIETMVCSRSHFKTASGLPAEGYISLQQEDSCGTVISFGVGGIYAEAWAHELHSKVLMWSPKLTTPSEALYELRHHWLGKVWLGELRQGKALTDSNKLLTFLTGIWELALTLEAKNINLLEMNPVVIDEDGSPIALDGVGTYATEIKSSALPMKIQPQALLAPKKVAIAGVSEKAGSFGRRILENLLKSSLDVNDIKIIKPDHDEFLGVKCYPEIKNLIQDPVDILVLALPAAITVKTLKDLCEQGSGAHIVYLVAGGIGDSGDKEGLAAMVYDLLGTRRAQGLWTPALIGPNSLGIVISPLKLSTLFIAPSKLPIKFHELGNIAFVSQSGAFFITRFSREEHLPIKYGFCVGNQMDLKISDLLKTIQIDSDIRVVGIYVEGFSTDEALRLAEISYQLAKAGIHIILYKGGKSAEGMKAAAGHTGAMAGNYELQKNILMKSGIYVTENFVEFSSKLNFLSAYPDYKNASKIAVISNAGFETVASADSIGSRIMPLNDFLHANLQKVFMKNGLAALVGAANPLDLTPMADANTYLECTEVFAASDADAILFCAVPLTDKLETSDFAVMANTAERLKAISVKYNRPVLVVVDSGNLYNDYREEFKKARLPTFSSIEEAFLALKSSQPVLSKSIL